MNDDLTPVIIGGARTPFGRFRGAISSVPATDLGAHAIKAALERSGVKASDINHVIMGQVILAGTGQGPARQASLKAGIGWDVPTVTINKLCLSGLTAVIDAARMIRAGEADFIVAAGQESMSNAPHLVRGMRTGLAIGDRGLEDSLNHDALADPLTGELMGSTTERGNAKLGFGRAEQDAYAAASHQRAAAAREHLDAEIAPISIPQRRGEDLVVSTDEGIRPETTVEKLAALRPAFSKDPGATITAGSSSPLSDGAAALVVASKGAARKAGLKWLCEIGAHGQTAGPDGQLHSQPSTSILAALEKEGLKAGDLDAIEINEAFASVVLQSAKDLGVDPAKVNTEGGAIALGHPVGASGARLVLHMAMDLARRGGGTGIVSLCGGGGQGDALVLRA
ncbi:acetyl-CoA C-acetyltransferase [Paeniglutamicibacter psychrophenolicus]|uniref:Probable acetyl-CoA acetyltransferase n=1 Tax=Paeniglutamicibacter psychrophenolicus TaxID=257454 RepID=A0ABS4WC89_9MICC|nr:acetyl-CoA C-acetyltransferase [Paeniglutamicibacter psychrophenolicus]MBP2373553.1 acetyl-CoA C-acetyltransferase [Paeniglutamicibacter psychrophenolicus]